MTGSDVTTVSTDDKLGRELTYPDPGQVDQLRGLTERERRFAEAYFEVSLQHGDQGALVLSYRRAFPMSDANSHTAYVMARGLLKSPRVEYLVAHLRTCLAERTAISAERVLMEVERVALSNMLDYVEVTANGSRVDLTRLTPATAAAISELTCEEREDANGVVMRRTKIKLHSKTDALGRLIKVHKLDVHPSLEDLSRWIRELERRHDQDAQMEALEAAE